MPQDTLSRKEELLARIRQIAEATADEMYERIETLPARELVALLSSSVELQSKLEKEISVEKASLEIESPDTRLLNRTLALGLEDKDPLSFLLVNQ